MLKDSQNVTLSPDESHSDTLTWSGATEGSYRVGVASADTNDYVNDDVVVATVIQAQLLGDGAVQSTPGTKRTVTAGLGNTTAISGAHGIYRWSSPSLTGGGNMSALQSRLLHDTTSLGSNTSLTTSGSTLRYVTMTMKNDTFMAFESQGLIFSRTTFEGSGTSSMSAKRLVLRHANMSGSGTVTKRASTLLSGIANFSGLGVQQTQNTRQTFSSTALSNSTTITANAPVAKYSTTTITGSGNIDTILSQLISSALSLSNSSALSSLQSIYLYDSADFSSSGNIIANNSYRERMVSTLSGGGTVEPVITKRRNTVEGYYELNAVLIKDMDMGALAGDEEMAALVLDR